MRKTTGWEVAVAAAMVAVAGCGGSSQGAGQTAAVDEHKGPDEACGQCFVTGGGQFFLGEQRVQFDVQAIPNSGPDAGPGFGGEGVSAKGHVSFQAVPASNGGVEVDAMVDTIVSCSREGGILRAVISGTEGGGRFTAVVTDGGEPANDTFAYVDSVSFDPRTIANGNIQVHQLDRCAPPCGEGQCLCPDDHQTCEPCSPPPPPPPPPVCLEGTCWNADTQCCEPCQIIGIPPPPAPLPQ